MSVMELRQDEARAPARESDDRRYREEPPEGELLRLEELDELEQQRPLTVADLERLDVPNDGRRYELVDGCAEWVSASATAPQATETAKRPRHKRG
ncbi:hypothetical protein [Salinactinospora qingdaonensis]|uniref:Uncharacterized protein n=1 Tax=Salinactinospora qingdaonensis TaxID=702744 RepID=A0ABP7FGN6_9ACTN